MAEAIDRVGQWLIQLPLLAQITVLCLALVVIGGFAAFALVGAIDVAGGRAWQASRRWQRRWRNWSADRFHSDTHQSLR